MFTPQDYLAILSLVFLEGILSVDNALVLAVMVKPLPKHQQKKALTYGIIGAFLFRLIALACLTALIKFVWIKILGGAYLCYLAIDHFRNAAKSEECVPVVRSFWATVAMVELMDVSFSIDSILAAVSVSENLTVIFIGGVLGIIMMRFAATIAVKLLEKYPMLSHVAYVIIGVLGIKLIYGGFQ